MPANPAASYPNLDAGRSQGPIAQARNALARKMRQCLDTQDIIISKLNDPRTSASEIASLVSAWDKLEDRIRILKGKPLPGSLKPQSYVKRPRPRPSQIAQYALPSEAMEESESKGEEKQDSGSARQSEP